MCTFAAMGCDLKKSDYLKISEYQVKCVATDEQMTVIQESGYVFRYEKRQQMVTGEIILTQKFFSVADHQWTRERSSPTPSRDTEQTLCL
jgi:hypothetical protein